MNCDIVVLIAFLTCWLLNYDVVHINGIEMTVYGKILMMNYEEDLVSLMISIIYFELWLFLIKQWCYIGEILVLGFIGWYDVELTFVDYAVRLIKVYMLYKDSDDHQCSLIWYEMLMC